MQVLITGGFGLIGGRLANYLQSQGHEITLGSRENRLAPKWLFSGKVATINYSNRESIERACKNIDILINAGGMNSSQCTKDPKFTLLSKNDQSKRLMQALEPTNIKKFIYISSAHIYANPLVGLITENSTTTSSHPYALSHLIGEKAALEARCDVAVLRLANTFGYPMSRETNCWMLLINDLCRQVVITGKIQLSTDGQQERNFISLSEVCRIIGIIVDHDFLADKIFNLGSDKSISVMQIARIIQERAKVVLNLKVEIKHPDIKEVNTPDYLDFKSISLKKNGILIDSGLDNEIDMLLKYCATEFN